MMTGAAIKEDLLSIVKKPLSFIGERLLNFDRQRG
jgi:hypothetical protein